MIDEIKNSKYDELTEEFLDAVFKVESRIERN
jgi:hypothetical protein